MFSKINLNRLRVFACYLWCAVLGGYIFAIRHNADHNISTIDWATAIVMILVFSWTIELKSE